MILVDVCKFDKFDLSLDLLINFPLPVGSANAMCNVCPDSFTYLAPFKNVRIED